MHSRRTLVNHAFKEVYRRMANESAPIVATGWLSKQYKESQQEGSTDESASGGLLESDQYRLVCGVKSLDYQLITHTYGQSDGMHGRVMKRQCVFSQGSAKLEKVWDAFIQFGITAAGVHPLWGAGDLCCTDGGMAIIMHVSSSLCDGRKAVQ